VCLTRVEHHDSVGAFVDQYKVLKSKLDVIGLPLPEEVYTINFIALLDTQYPVWSDRQRSNARQKPPALLDLIADILDESRKTESATTALYSGGQQDAKSNRKGRKSKEAIMCDHCEKQGHTDDSCWVKYPEKKPSGTKPRGKRSKQGAKESYEEGHNNTTLSLVAMSTNTGLGKHS
jgi:hypothetical protein